MRHRVRLVLLILGAMVLTTAAAALWVFRDELIADGDLMEDPRFN